MNESEKQLIIALVWFRTRYALFMGLSLESKANKENLELFGKTWMGSFKLQWDDAFKQLIQKKILIEMEGEYQLTDQGKQIQKLIEAENPFYKFEYDNYFYLESKSQAHAAFCTKVYGVNLSQHGLIDQDELSIVISKIKWFQPQNSIDLGCGNGKITEYLSNETKLKFTGVDISTEAIREASERTKDNKLLKFKVGNLNELKFSEKYDCILFLDTLYYATNLQETIRQAKDMLNEGGKIFAYFSQWIMDEQYQNNLQAEQTHLAKVLKELQLPFSTTDLTSSGIQHWKKKYEVLIEMKEDFVKEGNIELWEYRFREADRYAHWGDQKYARYLYEI